MKYVFSFILSLGMLSALPAEACDFDFECRGQCVRFSEFREGVCVDLRRDRFEYRRHEWDRFHWRENFRNYRRGCRFGQRYSFGYRC